VVDLWLAVLDKRGNKDSFAWIFVLLMLRPHFENRSRRSRDVAAELSARKTLSGRSLTLGGTWFEINRRLAGNLFHLGRMGEPNAEKESLLREAIKVLDFLLERDRAAAQSQLRCTYLGMRGVARMLLARRVEDKKEAYTLACQDLTESRLLGNSGAEASHYLIESHIHLYDADPKDDYLTSAEALLGEIDLQANGNRLLWFDAGEVALRRGFAAAGAGDQDIALDDFERARHCFQTAEKHPEHAHLPLDYIRIKRGQAGLRVYTTRHSLGRPRDLSIIDAAVSDLRAGGDSLRGALML
jgi:hypothetical protein